MEIFDSGHLSKLLWYLRLNQLDNLLRKKFLLEKDQLEFSALPSHKPWFQIDQTNYQDQKTV